MVILAILLLAFFRSRAHAHEIGEVINVLSLDGNQAHVMLPPNLIDNVGNATVETWVQWKSFKRNARIFDFGRQDNAIFLKTKETRPFLSYAIYDRTGKSYTVETEQPLQPNTWYHLAVVTGKFGMQLYINGELTGQNAFKITLAVASGGTNYIGKSNWPSDGTFHGYMCEFRIWNKARTAQEIQRTMHAQLEGNEENLVVYWRFDEMDENTSNDLTENAWSASLIDNATVLPAPGPPLAKVTAETASRPPAQPQPVSQTPPPAGSNLQSYEILFRSALQDGNLDASEHQLLDRFSKTLGLSRGTTGSIEREIRKELGIDESASPEDNLLNFLKNVHADGKLTDREAILLDQMKAGLNISAERVAALKRTISTPAGTDAPVARPGSPGQTTYIRLKKTPDATYHRAVGQLNITYSNPYSKSDWKYKIYNLEGHDVTPSTGALQSVPGENRHTLNLSGNPGFIHGSYYALEVFSPNKERFILRFKYTDLSRTK